MAAVKWEWLRPEPMLWHLCVCAYICICGCLTAEGCVLSIKVNGGRKKIHALQLNVGQGAHRVGGWAVPLAPSRNVLPTFTAPTLDAFRLCHHPATSYSRIYLHYINEYSMSLCSAHTSCQKLLPAKGFSSLHDPRWLDNLRTADLIKHSSEPRDKAELFLDLQDLRLGSHNSFCKGFRSCACFLFLQLQTITVVNFLAWPVFHQRP